LHYYQELMAGLRGAIETGTLEAFAAKFTEDYEGGDIEEVCRPEVSGCPTKERK
ncbi:MAG: hypothetical protein JEZ10_03550, partial [Verrucomicrobia bacterium]|nr:hypothetical protein [Verrucomicrobiota bacterium]